MHFVAAAVLARRPRCFEVYMKPAQETLVTGIIAQLECGVAPWIRPWSTSGMSGMPHNLATHRAYNGANVLQLWIAQTASGYKTAEWCTFQQAKSLGASVRKGEHGTPVWFIAPRVASKADAIDHDDRAANGVTFKQYTVFNRAQCDGLPSLAPVEPRAPFAPIVNAEAFVEAIGAEIRIGGDAAYYAPGPDFIACPKPEQFVNASAFYATLLHEHVHWTGAQKRLDRTFGKRFGDDAYAFEELVAELGAAFLTAQLELPSELRHAEYLGHWARVLCAEPKALWTASSAATRASAFLDRAAGLVDEHETAA